MKEKAYYETINVKNEVKLRKLLETLPPFCKQFFIGIEATSSSRTKIAYAYDIGCFFDYLHATIRSVLKWILQIFQSLF